LGLPWHPPADLCDRVLARLFPEVELAGDLWRTLLWATGRTTLPDRPQRTEWRWHSAPLEHG
ncbi:MAG: VOC family protein, partial [Actinomycetota bacterium]|nr:VOC family protein [Actinomycetota bacterium]